MSNSRYRHALELQKRKSEPHNPLISGILGITVNGKAIVEVPNRPSYVYVQVRTSQAEVIQALNSVVAPVYGLPVFIRWQGNRYVIAERDTMRYSNWLDSSAYLPRHAATHEFDGSAGDVVFVSQEQFLPLMPMPSGSFGSKVIAINDYNLMNTTGQFSYSPLQVSQDLTVWNPTSPTGAVMVLISLDAQSGGLTYIVNSGTVFGEWLTGAAQVLPYMPTNPDISRYIPIVGIRLTSGSAALTWDNLYDVRPMFQATRTIAGGGGGGGPTVSGAYLLLDGTNSPVTGPVRFQNDTSALGPGFTRTPLYVFSSGSPARQAMAIEQWSNDLALYVTNEGPYGGVFIDNGFYNNPDKTSLEVSTNMAFGSINYTKPDVQFSRHGGGERYNYNAPILLLRDYIDTDDAVFGIANAGGDLKTILNPMHTGTPLPTGYLFPNYAPYFFDTENTLLTGSPVMIVLRNTQRIFHIGGNGEVVAQSWMDVPPGKTYNVGGKPHSHTSLAGYGSIYADDATISVTITGAGGYIQVPNGLSDGGSDANFTFQNSRELKCNASGTYHVTWGMSVYSANNNEILAGTIRVNSTHVSTCEGSAEAINSGKPVCLVGTGIVNLAVNDLVSMVVENDTAAHNLTITHVNLTLVRIA